MMKDSGPTIWVLEQSSIETVMKPDMKPDKRKIWEYKNCKIIPIDCQPPIWGKCGEPIDFGRGIVRNRYWRIYFPDESWIHVGTKQDAREYIDTLRS